jgi:hypothetical protein
MFPAFYVAAILAVGWNLALTIGAYVTKTGPFRPASLRPRVMMDRVIRRVGAEVGRPDFDARPTAWRRGGVDTIEHVRARATEMSQEVTVAAPYAEASVPVATSAGEERRSCSVCMN